MDGELDQLGERIAEQAAHLDAATYRLLMDLHEFDERGGWHLQGAASCAHWLSWRVGWDLTTARAHVGVARKLPEFPAIGDALRRGEVSYSKVRAVLRVATPANEALLLDHARLMTASQLEKMCRKYALVQRHGHHPHPLGDQQRRYVRRRDTEDGMVKIEAVLHPEEAEIVWAMLDHAATQLARTSETLANDDFVKPNNTLLLPAATTAAPQVEDETRGTDSFAEPWIDDSAESRGAFPLPTTLAGGPGHINGIWVDDSAESGEAFLSSTALAAAPGHINGSWIDDSAESGEAFPSSTALAAAPGHINGTWVDDSAESGEAFPPSALTAAPGHINGTWVDDSAESHEALSLPTTPTAPAGHINGSWIDDSAESGEAFPSPTALAAAPGHINGSWSDDSAESHAAAITLSPANASWHLNTYQADDSAESRKALARPAVDTAVSLGHASTCCCEAAAEASTSKARSAPETVNGLPPTKSAASGLETPGGSLLDRLLDEAEALRDPEVPSRVDREASSDEHSKKTATSELRQQADASRRAFSRADALVSLAQGYLRGDQPNRSPIEITLTVPASSLRGEMTDPVEAGELGESFIAGQTARRLACDAGVIDVVQDEHGVPLSVGRKRRTIAGALKRALYRRDATCTFPSCTNRIFLEGHHIKHWADGGETSLENIALLCTLHHRFVHEYGYAIELGADQRPQFRDPCGRVLAIVPARPVTADLGWPQIRAANDPLGISADTIAGPWDGTPVDYGRIVGHLAAADGLR